MAGEPRLQILQRRLHVFLQGHHRDSSKGARDQVTRGYVTLPHGLSQSESVLFLVSLNAEIATGTSSASVIQIPSNPSSISCLMSREALRRFPVSFFQVIPDQLETGADRTHLVLQAGVKQEFLISLQKRLIQVDVAALRQESLAMNTEAPDEAGKIA